MAALRLLRWVRTRLGSPAVLWLSAGACALAASPYSAGWFSSFAAAMALILAAIVLSLAAFSRTAPSACSMERAQAGTRLWLILGVLVAVHGSAAVLLERAWTANDIDTYTFQRAAVATLVQGHNPYQSTQANIYSPEDTARFYGPDQVRNGRVLEGLSYPPLTMMWLLPGYVLGDIRYSYILAIMASAVLCFASFPTIRGFCLATFILANPITFCVENRCWTEPLTLFMLALIVYAVVRRRWLLPVAAGLFLASKQYDLLILPLLAFLVTPFCWKPYLKLAGSAVAIGSLTMLPFAIWDPRALWHDLVPFLLALPPRLDSMSFAVYFPVLMKIGPVLLILLAGWCLRRATRGVAMLAATLGSCLLVLAATGKQAFCNYYYLAGTALLIAATAYAERSAGGERPLLASGVSGSERSPEAVLS